MCGGTWKSLGYTTYVLHRTVVRERHIGLTCVVVHMGVPGISHIEQWDGIDTGLICAMVHMGVPGISYLCPSYEMGRDRHIGLTFVVVHMGVLGISYIEQCDRIDT